MRLSWAVLSCHTIILMLSSLGIGMEIYAFLSDLKWNAIKDNPKERFTYETLSECKIFNGRDGIFRSPTKQEYENCFKARKRDLPFEFVFLILMGFSFLMYVVVTIVYICWKKIIGNIYICITSNLLGTIIHMTSFGLLLASTLIYTDKSRKYMGSPSCYTFNCISEQGAENCTYKLREISNRNHDETRACMENLNICQLNGFKDRVVYLVFGCIVASSVALFSSCRRLRRKRGHKVAPNKEDGLKVTKEELIKNNSIPRPSLQNVKRKVVDSSSSTDSSSTLG